MTWIDVHTHLEMLENETGQVLDEAILCGVKQVITIGSEPKDIDKVFELAKKWNPKVFCTLGIHPHEAKLYTKEIEENISVKLNEPFVIGVGEIGLDFHYNHSPKEIQLDVFRKQIELAIKFNLPIEIHTREAESETFEILNDYKGKIRGLFHCFTGTKWLAEKGLDLGFDISFSGIVTFKNSNDLRDVLKFVPIDRMHIETDAPFLTPAPFRGKPNSPKMLVNTATYISDFLAIKPEVLSSKLIQNVTKLFPKFRLS